MKNRLALWLALFTPALAAAQSAPVAPLVTMGITLPVVNSPATVQVIVTDPALVLVPTGNVALDFGDGAPTDNLTLSNTRVAATHTYANPGQFTITATYAGDSNFAPTSTSLTTVSELSALVYNLNTFGDSITGNSVGQWPVDLAADLNWPRTDWANGGYKTQDEAPLIYQLVVDTSTASTWLLGQNDGGGVISGGQNQFLLATLAENAWLAIPEGPAKFRAQNAAVTQTGAWGPSDIFSTTGLLSSAAGSSLTATVPGSTIYVGLTSLLTTDYTVDVLIDGIDQGQLSPVSTYAGSLFAGEPYGARYPLGGSQTANHTVQVVCVNPGTSGCYVDWIGANGRASPNAPPYVFTGVSYTTLQGGNPNDYLVRQTIVLNAEAQLQSDGLAIRAADLPKYFSGPELPQCLVDPIHPGPCAADVLETIWLSSMSFLATEAQRIDVTPVTATVGSPVTLLATATSGLPVTFKVISGAATINGAQLTASQTGTVVVEADQPGTSTTLPAPPVQSSITVLGAPLTVTANNASRVYGTANPAFIYTISGFLNGDTQSATVSGAPALSTTATTTSAAGQYPITAALGTLNSTKYSFSFVGGTLTISDYALASNPGSLTLKSGQSGSTTITLNPLFNYQGTITLSCGTLPAYVSCTFQPANLAADGSGNPVQATLTIDTSAPVIASAGLPKSNNRSTGLKEAKLFWAPGLACGLLILFNRKRLAKAATLYTLLAVVALLLGLMGPVACTTSTRPSAATGTSTITVSGSTAGSTAITRSVQVTLNVQ